MSLQMSLATRKAKECRIVNVAISRKITETATPVSYTHLTLPTTRSV